MFLWNQTVKMKSYIFHYLQGHLLIHTLMCSPSYQHYAMDETTKWICRNYVEALEEYPNLRSNADYPLVATSTSDRMLTLETGESKMQYYTSLTNVLRRL